MASNYPYWVHIHKLVGNCFGGRLGLSHLSTVALTFDDGTSRIDPFTGNMPTL